MSLQSVLVILAVCVCVTFAATTVKPTKKPTPPPNPSTLQCSTYNVTLKLISTPWDGNLGNTFSGQFEKLRLELEAGVHQAFDGYNAFTGLKVNSFSRAPDGKTLVNMYLDFNTNGTHLVAFLKALQTKKLGTIPVNNVLNTFSCYVVAPIMYCSYPCPALCAPTCGASCCGSYMVATPFPVASPPPACPAPCSPSCAPSCSPACCQTAYSRAYNTYRSLYGKRHVAPRPRGVKKHLQKHKKALKKHHKKSE
ncbi:uncharacterized protein LOC116618868 isoform X2 [Nematostella vectensis]|uniref:uncharacterized protein LOC116618868 isoform X2 n=1 Tax=Nematostella vectensis TaxID=45351 RepID=UPI00138FB844|nr:uncharacterized protein LOC116618868 isoform X2 [Nematostella vectensis]